MAHNHGDHPDKSETPRLPWELYFAIGAGITYVGGMLAEYALSAPTVASVLFLATYALGGYFTAKEAIGSVGRGRFEVDFLMLVAALGAAAVGRLAEGAVLLFLFSLGHALEEYALARATRSIEALAALAPRTATVRVGTETEERPVTDLEAGDTLVVRPHARVPADGFVVAGTTAIDESAVTGESIPIEKAPVPDRDAASLRPDAVTGLSRVFAGTVNGSGAFDMAVVAAGRDTMLERVVTLVQDADAAQSPTQRFIDKFQRIYVPAVIVAVILVLAAGVVALGDSFSDSFYRAMVVLVAASPCALAIATPAAVLAGIARAARAGVLVKGGSALEVIAKVSAVAFDKTGTLTWGRPVVTDLVPAEGVTPDRLRAVALAVELLSDHPLAGAVVRDLSPQVRADQRLEASGIVAVVGQGVRATVDGQKVALGSLQMMDDSKIDVPVSIRGAIADLNASGRTTMVVASGSQVLGVVAVMDIPRVEAGETIRSLRSEGVDEIVLLSGDNQLVAESVGTSVGVDRAVGDLMPEGKVSAIEQLTSRRLTGMIGDGVNDAPAMARADVGIAMGAAGSPVALETADIAMMSNDLGRVPYVRRLGRETRRIIRQNLFVALGIVAILVPASLAGLAIGPIVFIHEGSTILIVLNSLRLLRFERGDEHRGITHEDRAAAL